MIDTCDEGNSNSNKNSLLTTVMARQKKLDAKFSASDQRDYFDQKNYGIAHFGLTIEQLPLENIAFDMLHVRLSISIKILTVLRDWMRKRPYDMQKMLSTILKMRWGLHYADCFDTQKSLNVLHGEQITDFLEHLIPFISHFIETNFISTNFTKNVIGLLKVSPKTSKLESTKIIIDTMNYDDEIKNFEKSASLFKEHAEATILVPYEGDFNDNHHQALNETFCIHCLTECMPRLACSLHKNHNVGLGIFNLQGMERRNKESKNAAKRLSDNKHSLAMQALPRCYDLFHCCACD